MAALDHPHPAVSADTAESCRRARAGLAWVGPDQCRDIAAVYYQAAEPTDSQMGRVKEAFFEVECYLGHYLDAAPHVERRSEQVEPSVVGDLNAALLDVEATRLRARFREKMADHGTVADVARLDQLIEHLTRRWARSGIDLTDPAVRDQALVVILLAVEACLQMVDGTGDPLDPRGGMRSIATALAHIGDAP